MPKAIDIPVELTVAKKPLTTEQTTPTHESMTPAKAKGFGCLSCPLLPTVKGVKIGSDYKGCNSKQLAAAKKRLHTHRMNGRGPKKAKVLVVFDRPESSEDRSGEAFTGGAAKSFKRMCGEFGIDTAHLRFTYAVRCHARKLTDTSAKACNGFLAAEIERIDPDMIVCVGSLPLRTVAGPSYGIESCAGSPFEHEVLGRKRRMLAIWSPQYMHVFTEKMDKWCEQFQTLAGMIDGSVKIGRGLGTYVQIKTAKEAAAALDAIQTGDVAVDLETNSLDPKRKDVAIPEFERLGRLKFKMKKSTKKEPWTPETEEATIAIVSWSTKIGTGFYVARDHIEGTWTDADRAIFDAALVRLLKRKTARKIFWNAMFECTWFRVKYGIRVRNYVDAMMWHYLYDENEKHSLKEASSHFTAMGRWDADIESVADDFNYNYRHLPLDIVGPYSGADPDGTLRVFRKIENKLPAAKKKIGKSFYPKLITALSGMQAIGAKGDPAFARFYEKFTLLHSKKAKRQIHDLPEVRRYIRRKRRKDPRKGKRDEWKFNLNSPNQIRDILFKVYKRDPLFFTDDPKNPQPKTNKVTLKAFKRDDKCPFSSLLLDYRHYDKRHGTYAMTVLEHLQAFAGTVRGYFGPAKARTGRLVSNGPNLQNIPDDAKRVYVSHFGDLGCIISLDYSQAELRVAGSVSNDENMLRVYREGRDIHEATMMAVYEMSAEELDRMKKSEDDEDKKTYKYRRTIAKRLNFGIIYLIGPGGIVNLLFGEGIEITNDEAAESIEKFMEAYPDLAQWIEDMKRYLRRHGKSRSPFGRERLVPAAMGGMEEDEERQRTQRALRQGVNAVIQGAASDLTLTSLILIDRELRRRGLKSRVILTVHDSIVIDALISEAAQVVKIARRIMENLAKHAAPVWGRDFDWSWIKCPIVSDAEVGINWRDGIKYDPADKSGEKATTISDAIAKSRGKMEAEDKRLREEYKELQKWLKEHDTAVAA
jgi:uracil-DNA glycosylase family 4